MDGGKSIENGAIINSLAHAYMHSLPRNHEEIINNMLRQYKKALNVAIMQEGEIKATQMEFNLYDCVEIPLKKDDRKYNRGKTKREWNRRWQEEMED